MKMVTVYLLGKKFSVPEDLTIMRAMEYSGFRLVRGCGCRSGFCGACAVVYRLQGQTETHSALACQTKVEDGMCVGRLESFPIKKETYDMDDLPVAGNVVGQLYPEIYNCIHCNACTRNCPQGIQVMKYIALAQRGDYAGCAKESFRQVLPVQQHRAALRRQLPGQDQSRCCRPPGTAPHGQVHRQEEQAPGPARPGHPGRPVRGQRPASDGSR